VTTRDAPTAAASAATGAASFGISSATPVANAAADAACPEGNDVVRGAGASRRRTGISLPGLARPDRPLTTTFVVVLAIAMPASPRSAARRAHLSRVAPRPAAIPSQSML
jgi:hypothetical protein